MDRPHSPADPDNAARHHPLMPTPRAAIIIPCFNHGRFVGDALSGYCCTSDSPIYGSQYAMVFPTQERATD